MILRVPRSGTAALRLAAFAVSMLVGTNAAAQDPARRRSLDVPRPEERTVSANATAERWLFATDDGSNDRSSTLYRLGITPTDGTIGVEVVGETGVESIFDIAFMGDRLMAVGPGAELGFGDDDFLAEIDPQSGTATLIATMRYSGSMNALEGESATTLIGATTEGEVWRIDLAAMTIARIGSFGSGRVSSGDLTFAHDGTLLGIVRGFFSDSLATISLANGAATTIGSTGYDEVYGLATHPETGALIAVVDASSTPRLATIQRSTGDATVIGRIPISREITGLAVRPAASIRAEFSWSPFGPRVGQQVQFTDSSSGSPDAWQWDFGDGTKSTQRHPKHVFATAGTFQVRLVSSRGADSASVVHAVSVIPDPATIVLTGKVTVGNAHIVGGGTQYRRVVRAVDASGIVRGEQDIAADGNFAISVPRGVYRVVAEIEYRNDTADIEANPTRTAHGGRSGCDGSVRCDIAFPNPIVFIHGLQPNPLADGRTRWDLWRRSLPSNVISFVPRYSTFDSAEQAADVLTDDFAENFDLFSEAPPFDIIAHSKGGLVSRVLKNQVPYGQKIASVALLGTPNSGANCYGGGIAGLSWCDLEKFNERYPAFPGNVFVIAGTAGSLCAAEGNAPSDGIVPVDSVFKISRMNGSTATGHTFPGVIVPQKHSDLGKIQPWLLEKVVLPAFRGAGLPHCPDPAYTTSFRACSFAAPVRPKTSQCISGYGLVDGAGETGSPDCLTPDAGSVLGVQLRWQAPVTLGAAPRNVQSTVARFEDSCPDPPANAAASDPPSASAGAQEGYAVYRSKIVPGQTSERVLIGWVPTTRTSFIDPEPLTGTSQYWIVAVYEESESAQTPSPLVTVSPSRRRTVRH